MSLDIEDHPGLIAYLRGTGRIDRGETPQCSTLRGGVSNKSVWVQRANGEAWVLKQALPKLRVRVDWFSDPARVHCEALGMSYLARLVPSGTIMPLIFEDETWHVIAMEAVPQPHENWKAMLLAGRLDLAHVHQFGQILGQVHAASHELSTELAPIFENRLFFETLRLEPYYSYTAQQVPSAAEFIDDLLADTRMTRLALVHGDYSPKNVLIRHDRLVLLDHEVIHWGDPAFDVGFSMTHLLSKAHHIPAHRIDFINAAQGYWQTYQAELGRVPWAFELEARAVRHTLACLLARVAGRSPLEYLSAQERLTQRRIVVSLMRHPSKRMVELIGLFETALQKSP